MKCVKVLQSNSRKMFDSTTLTLAAAVGLAEVGAIGAFALVTTAIVNQLDGFGWSSNGAAVKRQFNYHPFFMLLGFVVIQTQAIIAYRTLRNVRKFHVKCFHLACHVTCVIFVIVALIAVITATPIAGTAAATTGSNNFYSLHSWIGLAILFVYLCQASSGFITLFYPKLSYGVRESYTPYHRFVGAALHILVLAACLTGLMQLATLASVRATTKYEQLSEFTYTINLAAGALILNGLGIVILLVSDELRRPPDL